MKKILKLNLFRIPIIIIILAIIGAIWQSIMIGIEKEKYEPVGDYISVGTYDVHYYSKGDGNVAFVLIAGAGTPSAYTDFYNLQNHLSQFGQTIAFDHAGIGWSSVTDSPRTIENLVKELSIIIDTASTDEIVLICHSLGSLEAIGYAQIYPDKVKGIIFLDGGSPEFYNLASELSSKALNRTLAFTRFVGLNRLLGELGVMLPIYGENDRCKNLPDALGAYDKAMYYRYSGSDSNYVNIEYINENAKAILSGNRLGDIPILILSSDNGGEEWAQVQMQLLEWSNNSQQSTINNSGHYLYWTNYDETIAYLDAFIQDKLCESVFR